MYILILYYHYLNGLFSDYAHACLPILNAFIQCDQLRTIDTGPKLVNAPVISNTQARRWSHRFQDMPFMVSTREALKEPLLYLCNEWTVLTSGPMVELKKCHYTAYD